MPSRPTLRALVRGHRDLLAVIAVGGSVGSLARWGLAEAIPHEGRGFPVATFVTNVSGALLMGLLMAFVLGPWSHTRHVRPFLGVGVLGGYTTFSTYELDAHGLLDAGAPGLAFGYLAASLVAGLAAIVLGLVAGRTVIAVGERRHAHEISDTVPQED